MRTRVKFLMAGLVLAASTALSSAAFAQDPAGKPEDAEENLVAELIISSPTPGPAWWKVQDGDSVVWILGAPTSLPKAVAWDRRGVDRKLYKANVLLTPPDYSGNIFQLLIYLLTNAKQFRSETPMEEGLPPALRARFVAAREAIGGKASDFEKMKPTGAGMTLSQRFQAPLQMQRQQPDRTVVRMARRLRVKERHVAGYDIMPLLKSLATASPEAQISCLDEILKQVEAGREPILAAAKGWAVGDTRAATAAERGLDRCVASLPGMAKITRDTMTDTTEAIVKALDTPGKSVALVDLRPLLAKGGVIEQLQARGLKVISPAFAEEDEDKSDVPESEKDADEGDEVGAAAK